MTKSCYRKPCTEISMPSGSKPLGELRKLNTCCLNCDVEDLVKTHLLCQAVTSSQFQILNPIYMPSHLWEYLYSNLCGLFKAEKYKFKARDTYSRFSKAAILKDTSSDSFHNVSKQRRQDRTRLATISFWQDERIEIGQGSRISEINERGRKMPTYLKYYMLSLTFNNLLF